MLNNILKTLFLALGLIGSSLSAQPVDRVVAAHYPPLMIKGDAANPGYAVEVLKIAAQRAGREIDLSFMPFTRAMVEVRTGRAALMPALFFGKEPTDEFIWLAEIEMARMSFATLSDPVSDLATARALPSIVVEQGTTGDLFLTGSGFDNLVRVSTPASSARMLQGGRASAWMLEETLMRIVWRQLGFSEQLLFGETLLEIPIFLVASPSLPPDVVAGYQEQIAAMRADGTLEVIWDKYTAE